MKPLSLDLADELRLVSPAGSVYAPDPAMAERAIFRVTSPAAGSWTWYSGVIGGGLAAASPAHPDVVFAEAAVHSACQLLARGVVAGALAPIRGAVALDDQRWAGRPLVLQAAIDGPLDTRASVDATLQRPDGTTLRLALYDDGQHRDGQARDNVFGAVYRMTGVPGAYSIGFTSVVGESPAAPTCERQTKASWRKAPGRFSPA